MFGQSVPDEFTFLPVCLAGKDRLKEKHPQDSKKDYDLQYDKSPKRAAPGHVPETVRIEIPYGN